MLPLASQATTLTLSTLIVSMTFSRDFYLSLVFPLLVPKDTNDFDRFISLSFAKLGVIDYKSPDIVAEAVSVQAALKVDAIANSRRQGVVDCPIILNYFFSTIF